eukprot:GHVS01104217.1.p1 GENE.GHVS01104217.1~~GHVS01104217.1.p1  ORF type:complete len:288 (-),score=62.38 GHVS01104217.1:537-1355(-)
MYPNAAKQRSTNPAVGCVYPSSPRPTRSSPPYKASTFRGAAPTRQTAVPQHPPPPPRRREKSGEEMEEVCASLKELSTLDHGLQQLFACPPNTLDSGEAYAARHEQLVVYRGRLARRVSRYSQVVKGMATKLTSTDEESETQRWYHHHVKQLQQHKSRLSRWWSSTERHFHTLRMASFVSEVELHNKAEDTTCSSDVSTPPPTKLGSVLPRPGGGSEAMEESLKDVCRQSNSSTVPSSRTSSIDSQKPSFVDIMTVDQVVGGKWGCGIKREV